MYRPTRSSSFIAMTIGGVLAAVLGGCAHELTFTSDSEGKSAGLGAFREHADPSAPRSPSAVCDQYLALLSEQNLAPARQRYGTDGQCWSGDASQQRSCESECRSLTHAHIKNSLSEAAQP